MFIFVTDDLFTDSLIFLNVGMASDIQIQALEILRTKKRLNLLYKFHTGADLAVLESAMDR